MYIISNTNFCAAAYCVTCYILKLIEHQIYLSTAMCKGHVYFTFHGTEGTRGVNLDIIIITVTVSVSLNASKLPIWKIWKTEYYTGQTSVLYNIVSLCICGF